MIDESKRADEGKTDGRAWESGHRHDFALVSLSLTHAPKSAQQERGLRIKGIDLDISPQTSPWVATVCKWLVPHAGAATYKFTMHVVLAAQSDSY